MTRIREEEDPWRNIHFICICISWRQTIPARRARHGKATWTVAGSPATCDQKIISHYEPLIVADYVCRLTVERNIDARYGSVIWC